MSSVPTKVSHEPMQPVSLQSCLDAVAHERAALALARQLAAQGLLEGAKLRRVDAPVPADEVRGLLEIARDRSPPQAVVRLDNGRAVPFSSDCWTSE